MRYNGEKARLVAVCCRLSMLCQHMWHEMECPSCYDIIKLPDLLSYGEWKKMEEILQQLIGGKHPMIYRIYWCSTFFNHPKVQDLFQIFHQ